MHDTQTERSLGELFAELARESSSLVRQEIALARAELTAQAGRAAGDLGLLAVGGAVAYAGLLALLAAVIVGLAAAGLPWWLAALLVGLAAAAVGYALIKKGLATFKSRTLAPRRTLDTLRADVRWAKEQAR